MVEVRRLSAGLVDDRAQHAARTIVGRRREPTAPCTRSSSSDFPPVHPADIELLDRLAEGLAVAVRSSKDRSRLEDLLAETQRQAEELQTQQEELRVNNEELEEQGQALKASQAQLENQQAELEQTNSQLEEQMQLLEHQKDRLAKSQTVLTGQAAELTRSNQYKSEFLATEHECARRSLVVIIASSRRNRTKPEARAVRSPRPSRRPATSWC